MLISLVGSVMCIRDWQEFDRIYCRRVDACGVDHVCGEHLGDIVRAECAIAFGAYCSEQLSGGSRLHPVVDDRLP